MNWRFVVGNACYGNYGICNAILKAEMALIVAATTEQRQSIIAIKANAKAALYAAIAVNTASVSPNTRTRSIQK